MSHAYPPYLKPLPHYDLPDQRGVIDRANAAHDEGKRVVIASGVFDLLHEGHTTYLQKAKEQGDWHIVLVESDVRTREMKGEGRPVWDQEKRKASVLALPFVDDALILPPEFSNPLRFEEIVILLAPDVYAVSSHSVALENKKKLMARYGGEMRIVLDEIPGISTTEILAST